MQHGLGLLRSLGSPAQVSREVVGLPLNRSSSCTAMTRPRRPGGTDAMGDRRQRRSLQEPADLDQLIDLDPQRVVLYSSAPTAHRDWCLVDVALEVRIE